MALIMVLTVFTACSNQDTDVSDDDNSVQDESSRMTDDEIKAEKTNAKGTTERTPEKSTIQESTTHKTTVSGPSIPDPGAYLRLARNEDMYIEKYDYYCLSYKTDFDGQHAIHDYITLLSDGKYQLKLIEQEEETVYYLKSFRYAYEYTGSQNVPSIYNETNDISGDLLIFIQHNGQSGSVLMTLYFKPNAFALVDPGSQTSYKLKDLSGSSYSPPDSGDSGSEFTTKSNFDCFDCDGTGDCKDCGGDGFVWSSATDSERRDCLKCQFNKGKCNTCKGSGRRN